MEYQIGCVTHFAVIQIVFHVPQTFAISNLNSLFALRTFSRIPLTVKARMRKRKDDRNRQTDCILNWKICIKSFEPYLQINSDTYLRIIAKGPSAFLGLLGRGVAKKEVMKDKSSWFITWRVMVNPKDEPTKYDCYNWEHQKIRITRWKISPDLFCFASLALLWGFITCLYLEDARKFSDSFRGIFRS